jgi:AmmeMemoRadiSam system protein A
MSTQLSAQFRLKLLRVARQSLGKFLVNGERIQFQTEIPVLLEKRAVFVTLRNRENGDLRGCIGQSKPRYSLIEAVAKTAISSAVDDTRFPSLTLDELPDLLVEINVLSPLAPSKPENVEIGKHGLMINKGSKGALFLPEVAVLNGWELHTFLEELCRKADLPEGSWHDRETGLYVFETEAWGENDFLS